MSELRLLSSFPPITRLFVGLFTTLVLLGCLWAGWLFVVEWSDVGDADLSYPLTSEDEIDAIAADTAAALAPIWDTNHAGEPEPVDSGVIDTMEEFSDLVQGYDGVGNDDEYQEPLDYLIRRNLDQALVQLSIQTLLFIALGTIFLLVSMRSWLKKFLLWVFAAAIMVNAVGLSGAGIHWFFDYLLTAARLVLLVVVLYICVMIYVELGKSPQTEQK